MFVDMITIASDGMIDNRFISDTQLSAAGDQVLRFSVALSENEQHIPGAATPRRGSLRAGE
jgi:hypothetical protein